MLILLALGALLELGSPLTLCDSTCSSHSLCPTLKILYQHPFATQLQASIPIATLSWLPMPALFLIFIRKLCSALSSNPTRVPSTLPPTWYPRLFKLALMTWVIANITCKWLSTLRHLHILQHLRSRWMNPHLQAVQLSTSAEVYTKILAPWRA